MSKTDTQVRPESETKPVWRARLIAVAVAAVANAIAWIIASAAGVELLAAYPNQAAVQVNLVNVLISTIVAGGLGWLARAILDKIAKRRAALIWLIGASVAFAIELVPPMVVDATAGTKVFLLILHVITAAILIPVLAKKKPISEA